MGISASNIDVAETMMSLGCVIGVVLVLLYIFLKTTMYTVTFAGGSLSIKASSYNIKEVRAFDKILHQVKDEYLARR